MLRSFIPRSVILVIFMAIISAALDFSPQPAHALAKFSVVGDLTYSNTKSSVSGVDQSTDSKLGLGGGALLEFPFGLEIGALYHPRKLSSSDPSSNIDTTFNYLMIPVQLRFYPPIPFLTFGFGGYYAQALGDANLQIGSVSVDTSYDSLNFKKWDMGLLGTVGFNFTLAPMTALIAEVRYAFGLVNVSTSSLADTSTYWRDLHGLVGLRFGL